MAKLNEHVAKCTTCHEELAFDTPVLGYATDGHGGPGYYVYEKEYPEEGSVFLGKELSQPLDTGGTPAT